MRGHGRKLAAHVLSSLRARAHSHYLNNASSNHGGRHPATSTRSARKLLESGPATPINTVCHSGKPRSRQSGIMDTLRRLLTRYIR